MRVTLLSMALVAAMSPSTSGARDLIDVYRAARANDPVLQRAHALSLREKEAAAQARGRLLPTVRLQAVLMQKNKSAMQGVPLNGDGDHAVFLKERKRTLSLKIDQRLLSFTRSADLKAAKYDALSQDATYEAALQQLTTRVATAYFRVLTTDDAVTFAKANEEALARQLEQAQLRFDVGLSAITDVQAAKAQHATAVADAITAENDLADSRAAVTQMTGEPADNLKKLREGLPVDTPQPNGSKLWVAEAMKRNPRIRASLYNLQAAEHRISSARGGQLPTVDVTLGYSRATAWHVQVGGASSPGTIASNGRGGISAGLTLTVPIFSGGSTPSRVRQSIRRRDTACDLMESVRRQVVRDTLKLYRSVVAGPVQIGAARAAVESSEIAREATQAGFAVGTRTIVDVLLAQRQLTQALSAYSRARHRSLLSKLLLKESAGTVDVTDLKAINALLH